MSIFREESGKGNPNKDGKLSSKRIVGIFLITLFACLVIAQAIWTLTGVSDTILASILGGGTANIIATLGKKPIE